MQLKLSLLLATGLMSATQAANSDLTSIVYYKDIKCGKDATPMQISPEGQCHPLDFRAKSFKVFNAAKGCDTVGYASSNCSGGPSITVLSRAGPKSCAGIKSGINSIKLVCK